MSQSYIYKWTHLPTLKWYIGSRTKKNCHPNDGYLCSSKIVKPLIEQSPIDWRREILFLGEAKQILELENEILVLLDAKNDTRSFNMHNGDGQFTTVGIKMSDEWRRNISTANKGKIRSTASKENYKRANALKAKDPNYIAKLKKPKPEGHGANVSVALKGKKKSDEHCLAMSAARKGKKTGPCTDDRKKAIQKALKGKHTLPLVTCPNCGFEGRSSMKRWHFDNCKRKNKL